MTDRQDIPWPVVQVDLTAGTVASDIAHLPGAGALLVFWVNDAPRGEKVVEPCDALPSDATLLAWGAEFRGKDDERPQPIRPGCGSDVSLIIPTRDRAADLRNCLAALERQIDRPGQVVVVDNNPNNPDTRQVVEGFPGVTYVAEPRPGLDYARNAGIHAATKALIAFCDDDVTLRPDWTGRMAMAFDDPEVNAVTGLVLPAELATEAQRLFEFTQSFGRGFAPIDFRHQPGPGDAASEPWSVGAGASMAFRRTVFERLGEFDVRLDAGAAGCSGDSEMWYRVLMDGGLCRYVPQVVSFHRHRRDMQGLKRQMRAYMRGHVTALFVQNERAYHASNWRRAFFVLPHYYALRTARWLLRRPERVDVLLGSEVGGYFDGFRYYLTHRHERPLPPALEPGQL